MNLRIASNKVLDQLLDVLGQMREDDYDLYVSSLEATIGQHVRHIVEFYLCLFDGLKIGKVNYDLRKREKRIETDKNFTIKLIKKIKYLIDEHYENLNLTLEMKYGEKADQKITIDTNFERELAYNIEHTIHHLAIVKQAFREICRYIQLPEYFGIASSTIRYIKE